MHLIASAPAASSLGKARTMLCFPALWLGAIELVFHRPFYWVSHSSKGCTITTSYCGLSGGDKGLPKAFLSTSSLWGKRGIMEVTERMSFFPLFPSSSLSLFFLKANSQKKKKKIKSLKIAFNFPSPSVSPVTPPTVPPSGQIQISPFIPSLPGK